MTVVIAVGIAWIILACAAATVPGRLKRHPAPTPSSTPHVDKPSTPLTWGEQDMFDAIVHRELA